MFKLNIDKDVDPDGDGGFILNLPYGYRCDDTDVIHTRGFDSMKALRAYSKNSVMACDCVDCQKNNAKTEIRK